MAQVSAEKLKHTRPAEKERVASVPQKERLARTPEPPSPKGKSRLASAPYLEVKESVKVSENCTLMREGDQSESMKRKG